MSEAGQESGVVPANAHGPEEQSFFATFCSQKVVLSLLSSGRRLEKCGGGVAVRLFRRDRLFHPENLGLEIGDIGVQLAHPQQIEGRGE